MIQILIVVIAVMAIAMGANGIRKGEIAFTKDKPLVGKQAMTAAIIAMATGVLLLVFGLIVFPMIVSI